MSIDPEPRWGLKALQYSDEWICSIFGVNIHIIFTVTTLLSEMSTASSIPLVTSIDTESLSGNEFLHVWLLNIAEITTSEFTGLDT